MKKISLILILLSFSFSINAQTIFGKWHSRNEDTNKVDSVIEVYEKEGKAYAKVIEILDKRVEMPTCQNCSGENKDRPILGLNILTGLVKDKDEWSDGQILDPRNGNIYKCYIKLIQPNKLKLRGYIGFSLFGKSAYWKRVK